MADFTPNLQLELVPANTKVWAERMNKNLSLIDAVFGAYFIVPNLQGEWENSHAYTVGQSVIDATSSTVYTCQIDHVSASIPTTFAEDRIAHDSYWTVFSSPARARGAWTPNTNYSLNDFVINGSQYAVCIQTHTSGAAFATDLAAGKWSVIIDLSAVGTAVLPVPGGMSDANKFTLINATGTGYTIVSPSDARTILGATSIGAAVFTAVSQAAALTALGAQPAGSYQPLNANLTTLGGTITGFGLAWNTLTSITAARSYLSLSDPATPLDYGAVGDGVADDTTALNNFHAAVAAGRPGDYLNKSYRITAALNPIIGQNIQLTGQNAQIIYTGASTSIDIFTVGTGAAQYSYASVNGLTIGSTTVMTGGYACRIRRIYKVEIDIKCDDEAYGGKLYHGIYIDNCTLAYLGQSRVYTGRYGVTASDTTELHFQSSFIKGLGDGVNTTTGAGVLIAGGCGGVYFENLVQLLSGRGLIVDNSLSATENVHFFGGGSAWDTNYLDNIYLNDAASVATTKIFDLQNMWTASSVTGSGVEVANWSGARGQIIAGTSILTNNNLDGIHFTDVAVQFFGSLSTFIGYNARYGINAASAMNIYSDGVPVGNVVGQIQADIIAFTSTGYNRTLTVANGSNAALPRKSGLLIVANPTNGHIGEYVIGGGAAALTGTTAGSTWVASSTTPGAGNASIQYDGAGDYRLYNEYGSSQDFIVRCIVARDNV